MEPKKKKADNIIIAIVVLLLAVFLAVHVAAEYDEMVWNLAVGESVNIAKLLEEVMARLVSEPFHIVIGNSTKTFVCIVALVWFIVVAYISTNKKNFINDKEFGTSKWGTPAQIMHLHADKIKKEQLKRIKKEKCSGKEKREKKAEANQMYTEGSNIIYTQTEKICMYNYELNNNTMIIGGSGSGKTRGYVLPNILQCSDNPYSPSIVVTDPKGEILSKVGHHLERNGYEIKVLNLKEQNRSFCFNPFAYIFEDKYEEQISSLISSIFDSRSEKDEKSSQDPFWEDMAKVLLKAIFYIVYECYPKEEQNMATVMKLFRYFEVSDEDDRYSNPTKLDTMFTQYGDADGCYEAAMAIMEFHKTVKKVVNYQSSLPLEYNVLCKQIAIPLHSDMNQGIMAYKTEIESLTTMLGQKDVVTSGLAVATEKAMKAIDKYCEDRLTGYANSKKPQGVLLMEKFGDMHSNPAIRNWEDFRTKCKGKTAQSVTATALSKLAPFDEQQIRRIFSKDEMELDLVGERRTALFIILPPTNKNYNFIANLLYTVLFEQLEYCATVKHNQKLPVPVRFICDEFYNTGKIPNFENILSYARSFGIGISIILQSLDQIKEMYEKSWGTVLDNCSVFLYLGGIRHFDTLDYISKLLGKGTFDKKTYSRSKGKQGSFSTNFDKIGRELLDASEIQRLKKDNCLLFISGYQPYLSKKYNYPSHKNYKYTSDSGRVEPYVYKLPGEKE
ncbi:MAG: hypothetical protein E7290_10155 [Lachnospiraceae bacterium]|nr:hypothetical protein [Lachnospiraceae bacterium]